MLPKIGPLELVIVLAIVLLIFGVGRVGRLGRDLGEGIREFRRGISGDDEEKAEQASEAGEEAK
ncbi:MAG: twin-arginine translocase TatA/TatE family subunit [Deltaproteobacteria bacterium]|nr:twin-arginine translocase TatA/TatE family subunit [Deltaproteobacteria bacterium]